MKKPRRLVAREDGAIMVEAVMVIPILLTLFLGMVEFSQAFTARRKVGNVASTIADLVAQASSVTTADLNDIANVSTALLAPFPVAPLNLKLTSVGRDAQNAVTELWSCAWSDISLSPSCTATGAPYTTLPDGLIGQGESVLVVDATYAYTPIVGKFLLDGVNFSSSSYYKPRAAKFVVKN